MAQKIGPLNSNLISYLFFSTTNLHQVLRSQLLVYIWNWNDFPVGEFYLNIMALVSHATNQASKVLGFQTTHGLH